MLKISVRSILAHKLRLALTAIAVILGVAFASGMLMLTNALDRTFLEIFEGSASDVLVTPANPFEGNFATNAAEPTPILIPQETVDEISQISGVQAAAGDINQNGVYLLDSAGDVVGAVGPPALGVSWTEDPALNVATIIAGTAPEAANEIAVDDVTFPRLGSEIGDQVNVLTPSGQIATTLVGVFRFGESGGLAGATLTAFTPAQAQELFAEPGSWQSVVVATADGFTDDEVAAAISAALGPDFDVATREDQVASNAADLRAGLSFLTYILLGFAGIALFVAAFLIYNTFAMLIAQRSKEMALLRAIGATQKQVLTAVLVEAIVLGLLAALLGVAVGYGLALLLKAGVGALGLELSAGITPTASALALALGLGLTVTVLSAVVPALHAARTKPIAALREASTPAERPGRLRTAFGLVVALVAAAGLGQAFLATNPNIGLTALAALLLLVAAILLAPLLAMIFAKAVTPLLAASGGVPGRIAGRNAARSPRRVAATASALIVGLALVTGVTVIVSSAQASVNALIDRAFGAELVITTATGQPFAPSIAESIRAIDGVDFVISQANGSALVQDQQRSITAFGGGPLSAVYNLTEEAGSLAALGAGTAVAESGQGWSVGDRITLGFASGQEREFEVVGLYSADDAALLGSLVIDLADYRAVGGADQDTVLFVDLADDADTAQTVAAVTDAAGANPLLQVSDQTTLKEQNTSALNQLLYLIYAMLGLSIIIAVLGVINTTVLSVVERTRELGLLRAIGAARSQVRRMIRWEAVLVAVLGGLTGVSLGLLAGVALQRALADSGIDLLRIPVATVLVLLLAALLIGVLAAVLPARRAARIDILRAIATE